MYLNISVITASRRPEGYLNLVKQLEETIPDIILEYLCFIDNKELQPEYVKIRTKYPKVKIILAESSFIFKKGWDSVYTILTKYSKGDFIWQLFDSDDIKFSSIEQFKKDVDGEYDLLGIPTLMQRGNSDEIKFQLYKNNNLLYWYGLVHENQIFLRNPNTKIINSVRVNHNNALDKNSKEMKKTDDGIPIIEMEDEGTDGYLRNLLYESLVYEIVNNNGRHQNKEYLIRYYNINKLVIDAYYKLAIVKWGK
jgi:hypothetical protein